MNQKQINDFVESGKKSFSIIYCRVFIEGNDMWFGYVKELPGIVTQSHTQSSMISDIMTSYNLFKVFLKEKNEIELPHVDRYDVQTVEVEEKQFVG